ncbi:MAG: hypothetical protein ACWGSD_02195, partial [Thermodesulfobacteriota bacterium]
TGGSGGSAAPVTLSSSGGAIVTLQDHAEGVLVQSIGGGGGRGALAVSAGISTTGALNLGLGGSGGPGGAGGNVSVTLANAVSTGPPSSGSELQATRASTPQRAASTKVTLHSARIPLILFSFLETLNSLLHIRFS